MRQSTVVRIPTMPSINPTKRRLWEYIFRWGAEGHWSNIQGAMVGLGFSDLLGPRPGHWSSLQGAMIGLDFSDILGPHSGHWSDTQEAI